MTKKVRLYVVQVGENEHFVRASSPSGAIHTIIRDRARVRVAETDDVFRLAQKRGVEMKIIEQPKQAGPGRPPSPVVKGAADTEADAGDGATLGPADDTRTLPLDLPTEAEPESREAA